MRLLVRRLIPCVLLLAYMGCGTGRNFWDDDSAGDSDGSVLTLGLAANQPTSSTLGRDVFVESTKGTHVGLRTYAGHQRFPGASDASASASCIRLVPGDVRYVYILPDKAESEVYAELFDFAGTEFENSDFPNGLGPCADSAKALATRTLSVSVGTDETSVDGGEGGSDTGGAPGMDSGMGGMTNGAGGTTNEAGATSNAGIAGT